MEWYMDSCHLLKYNYFQLFFDEKITIFFFFWEIFGVASLQIRSEILVQNLQNQIADLDSL